MEDLGVSDVAIAKHIKKLGLSKPPVGYWRKVQCNIDNGSPGGNRNHV